MTQPSFVPISEADQVRPAFHLDVPSFWAPNRPADLHSLGQPTGRGYGSQGPDQGYALRLAHRLEGRLCLSDNEEAEDVILGAALIGARRASSFGRAPCIYDVEFALNLFGYLSDDAPADLVESRSKLFGSLTHSYQAQRALVDSIPAEVLRSLVSRAPVIP